MNFKYLNNKEFYKKFFLALSLLGLLFSSIAFAATSVDTATGNSVPGDSITGIGEISGITTGYSQGLNTDVSFNPSTGNWEARSYPGGGEEIPQNPTLTRGPNFRVASRCSVTPWMADVYVQVQQYNAMNDYGLHINGIDYGGISAGTMWLNGNYLSQPYFPAKKVTLTSGRTYTISIRNWNIDSGWPWDRQPNPEWTMEHKTPDCPPKYQCVDMGNGVSKQVVVWPAVSCWFGGACGNPTYQWETVTNVAKECSSITPTDDICPTTGGPLPCPTVPPDICPTTGGPLPCPPVVPPTCEELGNCPVITVSCSPSSGQVDLGESVTWSATALGGTSAYSYEWRGSDGLSNSTAWNHQAMITYSSIGSKTAEVRATADGRSSEWATCSSAVNVVQPEPPVAEITANPSTLTLTVNEITNVTYKKAGGGPATSCVLERQSPSGAFSQIHSNGGGESVVPQTLTTVGTWNYRAQCTGPGGTSPWVTTAVEVVYPPPNINLTADPSDVKYGEKSTLSWDSTWTEAVCTASADPSQSNWSGNKSNNGNQLTGELTAATTRFSLFCPALGDYAPAQDNAAVTVCFGKGADVSTSGSVSSNTVTVREGDQVAINWNTGTSDPAHCVLRAGSVILDGPFTETEYVTEYDETLSCGDIRSASDTYEGVSGTYYYTAISEAEIMLDCEEEENVDTLLIKVLAEFQET